MAYSFGGSLTQCDEKGPVDPSEPSSDNLSGTTHRVIRHSFGALLIRPVVRLVLEVFRVPVEHTRENERVRINRP